MYLYIVYLHIRIQCFNTDARIICTNFEAKFVRTFGMQIGNQVGASSVLVGCAGHHRGPDIGTTVDFVQNNLLVVLALFRKQYAMVFVCFTCTPVAGTPRDVSKMWVEIGARGEVILSGEATEDLSSIWWNNLFKTKPTQSTELELVLCPTTKKMRVWRNHQQKTQTT